jgi:hypothetical protein
MQLKIVKYWISGLAFLSFFGGFFMGKDEIKPVYKVVSEKEVFGISGKEETTGESFVLKGISEDEKMVFKIAELLNKNKVSICHAKDVIRDFLLKPVL